MNVNLLGRVCVAWYRDADHDGFSSAIDCNDLKPTVHPGATEVCNYR
jgi:hypothetical protein